MPWARQEVLSINTHLHIVYGRWVDAGKFLTGFSAVGSIAIPAVLAHAQVRAWLSIQATPPVQEHVTQA